MSRLAFIADVHIGNPSIFGGPMVCGINTRGEQVLDTLHRAVEGARSHDALVICGDLFDVSNPSPQLIREVQEILVEAPQVLILLGNHDMVSTLPGDHALGPLRALSNVTIVEKPTMRTVGEDALLMLLPFQPADAKEWFPEAVRSLAASADSFGSTRKRVLVFHLGVADSSTPAFLRDSHEAIDVAVLTQLMRECSIDYAYCGNWHTPARWGTVVQCGALCPTGWDNPGWDYGRVRTLDSATGLQSDFTVPGPRFLNVSTEEEALAARIEAVRRNCELYLTLKKGAASSLDVVRQWGVQARAVADTSEAKDATRAAAVSVREAGTLKEALARYVSQMPVADGVDRQKVQALAGNYLTRGA